MTTEVSNLKAEYYHSESHYSLLRGFELTLETDEDSVSDLEEIVRGIERRIRRKDCPTREKEIKIGNQRQTIVEVDFSAREYAPSLTIRIEDESVLLVRYGLPNSADLRGMGDSDWERLSERNYNFLRELILQGREDGHQLSVVYEVFMRIKEYMNKATEEELAQYEAWKGEQMANKKDEYHKFMVNLLQKSMISQEEFGTYKKLCLAIGRERYERAAILRDRMRELARVRRQNGKTHVESAGTSETRPR